MIEALEMIADRIEVIIGVALGIIIAVAVIRTIIRMSRGESINVPPVGVMNDLPSSVTGISKHNDISERSEERSDRKID
ncbi:MAG: hypothetical protein IJH43_00625 [Mogibacterium sp.]|nr:hypothetical protein [Mogibacterium sp.]